MKARILGLIALELLLALVALWVLDVQSVVSARPGVGAVALFAAAMVGLTSLPRIYLEHRRHGCWITPADGAILVGLFTLGPIGFVIAAMSAEAVIAVRFRQPPLKLLFNLTSMFGGYSAAAATFAALGRTDPLDPLAWAAGLVAMTACAVWDVLSTAGLFAIAERRPFREMINGVGPALLLSLVLSAALGLVALVLLHETPFGALLVAPVLAILVVSTRSVTHAQAERNRLERLYAASGNLAAVTSRAEALAGIAAEGRRLITGAAAACLTRRPDGSWVGVLVDDDGSRHLAPAAVAHLVEITARSQQGVADLGPRPASDGLPDLPSVVWSTGTADPDVQVRLAVFLDLPSDEQNGHRVDVVTTFVAHAVTVLANVELHEDVQEALEHQVQLNRQKGEFVAAVSHELRTPLASMIGAVQTVQRARDRMTDAQLDDVLALGSAQGARLRRLIEDLLLVAAAEHREVRIEQRDVDLADVLAEVVRDLGPAVRDRVRLELAPAGPVRSDREKLHRIALNLIDNAGKYAPEGPIDVTVVRGSAELRLTVDDAGPGVDPDDRERIFERFVQLDQSSTRRQGGTGLGLHLSRELAGLLGGTLTVTTSPRGGARFELMLPQGRARDLAAVTGSGPADERAWSSANIASSPLRRPVAAAPRTSIEVAGSSPPVGGLR